INDETIAVAIRYASQLPSPQCEIFFAALGGEAGRMPVEATAYCHRDANYVLNVHARWDTPAEDEKCVTWARDFFRDSAAHATGGVYINFMTEEETDRVKAAYGVSYERLKKVKRTYDPHNLFRLNQNIAVED
ncbi:MAG: FAD-linked oxidase, partial [Candidatus Zixiibacteriota bacterium]